MTTITDVDRAARLRNAERYIRAARKEMLAAQLPPEQWAITRHDVQVLNEIALSCMDFADGYEWADVDQRTG